MKVLHISTSDRQGGAAIAAYRLNEALQNEGVDSKMLVYNKITLNPTVERFSSFCSIWEKLFYKPLIPLRTLIKEKMLHNVVTFSMGRDIGAVEFTTCLLYKRLTSYISIGLMAVF